jgi:hypothetical protein
MLREALHRMVEVLTAGRDRRMQAIGHYVEALLAGSAKGPNLEERHSQKSAVLYRSDPDSYGDFACPVEEVEERLVPQGDR